ncbi:MAG: response regulator transcription factor [Turicibacter sp.]|nr:response regulator transcription factor [Turicibacter sp.]
MENKLIYIAEDEKNIRNLISSFLVTEGYEVGAFETGDLLYGAFLDKPADLVILDVMMPGSSGFLICTKLREISSVPIIMLTARDTDEDFISGISLGSDAYFTKPFSPVKLIMQVKAMLRRVEMDKPQPKDSQHLEFGDLDIHVGKLTAFSHGKELKLTQTEFRMLAFLVENQERAVSREELLNKVWGYDSVIETRATDDTVKRLRKKLADNKSLVQVETVRGYGFKIRSEGACNPKVLPIA